MLKGVLRADDAERALAAGVDGIVLSNHGGRQLDGAVSAIDALPEIARAVGGRASILVDGGVRRGSDIAKAVALGAEGVLLGRAPVYGLAAGGRAGVAHALGDPRRRIRSHARADRMPGHRVAHAPTSSRSHESPARGPSEATCCGPGASRRRSSARSTNCCRATAFPTRPRPLDLDRAFGRPRRRVLEIGFGNGDTLVELAARIAGARFHRRGSASARRRPLPARGRVARAHERARRSRTTPSKCSRTRSAPASLDEVLLYFPDPWPKKRHHKRRIVQPAFAALVASRLKRRRRFKLATDWEPYAAWMLEVLDAVARARERRHRGMAASNGPSAERRASSIAAGGSATRSSTSSTARR